MKSMTQLFLGLMLFSLAWGQQSVAKETTANTMFQCFDSNDQLFLSGQLNDSQERLTQLTVYNALSVEQLYNVACSIDPKSVDPSLFAFKKTLNHYFYDPKDHQGFLNWIFGETGKEHPIFGWDKLSIFSAVGYPVFDKHEDAQREICNYTVYLETSADQLRAQDKFKIIYSFKRTIESDDPTKALVEVNLNCSKL